MTAVASISPDASPTAPAAVDPSTRRIQSRGDLVLVKHAPDQLMVLILTGRATTAADVYVTLNEAFSQRPVCLVLDASEVRSWDRLWLAVLLDSSQRAAEGGIRFAIADRSGRLPSTIEEFQGRLRPLTLQVHPSSESAIDAVRATSDRESPTQRLALEVDQLRSALETQAVIEQAKGALMMAYGLSPVAAFAALRRYSQDHNVKLRDVARHLLQQLTKNTEGPVDLLGLLNQTPQLR